MTEINERAAAIRWIQAEMADYELTMEELAAAGCDPAYGATSSHDLIGKNHRYSKFPTAVQQHEALQKARFSGPAGATATNQRQSTHMHKCANI